MNITEEILKKYFEKIRGRRVLVVGDLILDRYVWGNVERISPEAPVPVVEVYKDENRLGGAANVALNLKSLEMEPVLIGAVGEDTAGNSFIEIAEESGINVSLTIKTKERPTTVKTRVIGNHQQMLRIDREEKADLNAGEEKNLLENIKSLLNAVKIEGIILEDYNKGVLTKNVITQVIKWANELGIPTFVDPKFENFTAYKDVTLFKPNLIELSKAMKTKIHKDNLDSLRKVMQMLREEMPHKITLVTLGDKGVAMIDENDSFLHIPAHYRSVVDVSGAGDTVISTVASAIMADLPTKTAIQLGNLAGGLVCEELGVVPIRKERLSEEIRLKSQKVKL